MKKNQSNKKLLIIILIIVLLLIIIKYIRDKFNELYLISIQVPNLNNLNNNLGIENSIDINGYFQLRNNSADGTPGVNGDCDTSQDNKDSMCHIGNINSKTNELCEIQIPTSINFYTNFNQQNQKTFRAYIEGKSCYSTGPIDLEIQSSTVNTDGSVIYGLKTKKGCGTVHFTVVFSPSANQQCEWNWDAAITQNDRCYGQTMGTKSRRNIAKFITQ